MKMEPLKQFTIGGCICQMYAHSLISIKYTPSMEPALADLSDREAVTQPFSQLQPQGATDRDPETPTRACVKGTSKLPFPGG
ncbi:hypothetical protein KIL84_005240 [Mauremys mutica]|uniref:Uncharacterized protein n=1 Tax=Mauremys mutica TaxID=74926 RepID=A0A9D4B5X2_9SAUR|nr:hypothetical protein KIL84_005240 [Mauremys mutica]